MKKTLTALSSLIKATQECSALFRAGFVYEQGKWCRENAKFVSRGRAVEHLRELQVRAAINRVCWP